MSSNSTFSLDQIFLETYPPEAAEFCNSSNNQLYIKEIDPQEITRPKTRTIFKEDGSQETEELSETETVSVRRFQITAVPKPSAEELASILRSIRNSKLAECDYITCGDLWSAMSEEKQAEWSAYRQALRDLPSLEGFPWDGGGEATPWPKKPD